jgi:8-oxo-dGTP diphosphatase
MGLRKNTGFCDGMFHLPAGHLEDGETLVQGIIREAKEELAIEIANGDLTLVHVMHHNTGRIAFFFEARTWTGDIKNNEPDKCERLSWFPLHQLPNEVVPYTRVALGLIEHGQRISAFGW